MTKGSSGVVIAYFILVHRYPGQFKRLFESIYSADNLYLIHVDKRAGMELYKEVKKFLLNYPNAQMLKSQEVVWGGYSMVEAELRGMKKLLFLGKKWDFFINLSGQDFPLKNQLYIKDFLSKNIDKNYLLVLNQKEERPITMNRVENYFVETAKGFLGTPRRRHYLENVTPFIGGQWKILSRKCCEFICTSPKVAKYRKFYKHTLIPDEGFFQTVLMNTGYRGEIVNDDKRAIVWIPDLVGKLKSKKFTANTTKSLIASGKIKLRPKTFLKTDIGYLSASKALFARKFDESVDSEILDLLETKINPVVFTKPSVKISSKFQTKALPMARVFNLPIA